LRRLERRGLLAYTIWRPVKNRLQIRPLFQPMQGAIHPAAAAREAGQFSLVYGTGRAEESAAVVLLEIGQAGTGPETELGQGSFPEIYRDPGGQLHLAWCGSDSSLNYMPAGEPVEVISFPPCINRPGILQDFQGKMHLVWVSGQVEDNFGNRKPAQLIYESMRIDSGWGQPAILAQLAQAASLAAVSRPEAGLSLVWGDAPEDIPALFLADQKPYQCEPESLTATGLGVLQVVEGGEFHPAGYQSPFCGNQFKSFVYMPGPDPHSPGTAHSERGLRSPEREYPEHSL
jgi:hypothetical protein